MTASEAFNLVERSMLVSDSGIVCDGKPLLAAQVAGLVFQFHGKDWAALEDLLQAGRINPDQYAERAIAMVESFHRYRQRARVEKKIIQLKAGIA